MVRTQIASRGVRNSRVLDAMRETPREAFVPDAKPDDIYADSPLSIGHGQMISQPFTVAFMAAALQLTGNESVLEIGAGSGYGAAVLSKLARVVFTIERNSELARQAREQIALAGCNNVTVVVGDGTLGLPEKAPFDAISVTAFGRHLPAAYQQQLKDQGRIIMPVGESSSGQKMMLYTRRADAWIVEDLGSFTFVPLVGRDGWETAEVS